MTVELNRERVLWALSMHKGAAAGVHVGDLVREICGETTPRLERSLRKVVEALREEQGHHICAHPSVGYFIAATPEELEATCAFLIERAMSSLKKVVAIRKTSLPELLGQLRLPT